MVRDIQEIDITPQDGELLKRRLETRQGFQEKPKLAETSKVWAEQRREEHQERMRIGPRSFNYGCWVGIKLKPKEENT